MSQPLHDVRWISAVDHASEPAYYPSTSSIDELVWLETVSQPYAYIIQQLDGDLAEAASAQDPELPSVDRNAVERCLGIVPFILLSLGDLGTLQFAAVGESDGGVNLVVRAPSRGKRLSMIIPPTMVRPIIVMRVDISVGVVTSECHSIQDLPGHLSWLKN